MELPRIAVDIGSTSIKAIHYNRRGTIENSTSLPFPVENVADRITHDPETVLQQIKTIPQTLEINGEWEVALTAQRSTFILWERESGNPVTKLISWRDRRGEDWIERLSREEFYTIQTITGLRPEAGYPLSKLRTIFNRNHELHQKARNGQILYGPIDTWLLWILSKRQHWSIDPTQASRTLLYHIDSKQWSDQLLDQYSIPREILPPIRPRLKPPVEAKTIWPGATVIHTIGDQPASTLGGQPPPYEETRVTLGTGGFVASPCAPDSRPDGLNLSFTPTLDAENHIFQAEGVVLSAGRAVDWLQNLLGIDWDTIEEWLSSPFEEDIPLWCPALNGVGAPFWSNRPAELTEFSEQTGDRELMIGMVVSVLMRIRDILKRLPHTDQTIRLDGGLSKLGGLPELASALWEHPVNRTVTPHLTARGALVASHGSEPYLDDDPWSTLETTAVKPRSNLPVSILQERWNKVLADWKLEVPQ